MTAILTSTPSLFSHQNFNPNAAKEKLEIVSGAAHFDFAQYEPPPFRPPAGGFAGRSDSDESSDSMRGFFQKNAFGLIQKYRTTVRNLGKTSRKYAPERECRKATFVERLIWTEDI